MNTIKESVAFNFNFIIVFNSFSTLSRSDLKDDFSIELHVVCKYHHSLLEFFRFISPLKLGQFSKTGKHSLIFSKEAFKVEFCQISENMPFLVKLTDWSS